MLHENLNYLKINRLDLFQKLVHIEKLAQIEPLLIQEIKSPYTNLSLRIQEQNIFLHDPSNPWEEASQMIQTIIGQITRKEHHVFFFGAGLAYHIRSFVSKYPNVPYSIYEPSAKVLMALLREISLKDMNISMLRNVFTGIDRVRTVQEIKSFIYQTPNSFTILTLPSYRKAFADLNDQFIKITQQLIERKQQQLHINHHFEKKWVYNSLRNFRYTIDRPSIFDYQKHFENKPVLLVAAGPSLLDEMDNIRKIKDQGSAYIFAVGSAINVFIDHHIVPDAAFTYDPGPFNRNVFTRAIQEKMVSFPLVYGTTVGEGTLEQFPGLKYIFLFHKIQSQHFTAKKIPVH